MKIVNSNGKIEIEPGTKLRALVDYCEEKGLEFPFYLPGDLDKPFWRIVNEDSITFKNLFENITKTEAMLPNGDTLFSSPDNPVAQRGFDIKSIILAENENLCFVDKFELEFDEVNSSFRKKIVILSDDSGYNVTDLDDLLGVFLENWEDETKVNVIHFKDNGVVERILKFSSRNKSKVRNEVS